MGPRVGCRGRYYAPPAPSGWASPWKDRPLTPPTLEASLLRKEARWPPGPEDGLDSTGQKHGARPSGSPREKQVRQALLLQDSGWLVESAPRERTCYSPFPLSRDCCAMKRLAEEALVRPTPRGSVTNRGLEARDSRAAPSSEGEPIEPKPAMELGRATRHPAAGTIPRPAGLAGLRRKGQRAKASVTGEGGRGTGHWFLRPSEG